MQVHGSVYRSIAQCTRTVYRNEGLAAFYISYPTTLCMTVPFTALQFTAYESLSKVINPGKGYDPITHCTSGALAGAFAAGLTTPLDVIKTLLQTRGTARDIEIRSARGLFRAAAIIKQQHGYAGFFRGLRPRIITTMPSTAICWYVSSSSCRTRSNPLLTLLRGRRMRWPKRTSFATKTIDLALRSRFAVTALMSHAALPSHPA